MSNKTEKISQLERSVLDLGTELYRLKIMVSETKSAQQHYVECLTAVRSMFHDKGFVSRDEFDSLVDIEKLMGTSLDAHSMGHGGDTFLDKLKKISH